MALGGGDDLGLGAAQEGIGGELVGDGRGHRRLAARALRRRRARLRARASRCPARRPGRSGCWPACIRARSRRACRRAAARAWRAIADICAGVPSKSRPQPQAKSVSPHEDHAGARRRRCGPRCGRARRAPRSAMPSPGTTMRSPSRKRLREARRSPPRRARTPGTSSARPALAARPRGRRGGGWRGWPRARGRVASRKACDGRGIAGIDHRGLPAVLEDPEVVVLERGHGVDLHHGAESIRIAPWRPTRSANGSRPRSGQYLLEKERAYLDDVTPDIFGFHALQLGLPELDLLRESRIAHRMRVAPWGERREPARQVPRAADRHAVDRPRAAAARARVRRRAARRPARDRPRDDARGPPGDPRLQSLEPVGAAQRPRAARATSIRGTAASSRCRA